MNSLYTVYDETSIRYFTGMIALTRLNGSTFYINPDHIWTVEATPDTVVTMLNGERLLITETCEKVSQLFLTYKMSIHKQKNTD